MADITTLIGSLKVKHDEGVKSEISFLIAVERSLQRAIEREDWDKVRAVCDTVSELADQLTNVVGKTS